MLEDLKAKNAAWSKSKTQVDPDFFKRLEGQQSPEYLWIGCSDSRVPANEIVGLDPGELFVHRHVDHWLHPIREVCAEHKHELAQIPEKRAMLDRLTELNVARQVRNVAADVFVQDAWARGQQLAVHGWVYSLHDGLVTDLDIGIASLADYERVVAESIAR